MTTVAAAASQKKPRSRSSARSAGAKSDFGFPLPLDTPPIEARSSEKLPDSAGPWQYEPKWDGFRCLAFKSGDMVDLRAKSGKPLGRYFPEVVALLREVVAPQFVVDGELVIELDGRLAFDALHMRCILRKLDPKARRCDSGAANALRYARR
jgi:ATP-dependent DNA ligase